MKRFKILLKIIVFLYNNLKKKENSLLRMELVTMQLSDLLQAIRENQIQLVDGILQTHPHWLNEPDQRGSTPLLLSTYYGHLELSQMLLNRQPDIDVQDKAGNTALMGVCFKQHNVIAKQLIEAGADIEIVNHSGANALIYCAMFGNDMIAKLLLEKGAKKAQKDEQGMTAADHAKLKGNIDLAKLLD